MATCRSRSTFARSASTCAATIGSIRASSSACSCASAPPTTSIPSSKARTSAPSSNPMAPKAGWNSSSATAPAGAAQAARNIPRASSMPSAPKPSFQPTRASQLGLFTLQELELGKVGLEGALRVRAQPRRIGAAWHRARLRRAFGRGWRLLRGRAAGAGRGQPLAHRARAVGRGAVLQRPAYRHPGVRDRRSRSRQGEAALAAKPISGSTAATIGSASPSLPTASTTSSMKPRPARRG